MNRIQFRELVVKLLYIDSVGGDFLEEDYAPEVLEQYKTIKEHLEQIDTIIETNLVGYTIDRLNFVDLAIVRNSVYEMLFTDLPKEISINEAINLTKRFSNLDDDSAKRFNNRLLDNIRKSLEK
ncbi:MAG: transcription antitermination protein NusB [Bacilli bacterium]|nr:transcription antitermination protein NusB [Bacilli bacterium]MBN2877401.1 transcription antitermination protein NusB [Bacilli bacterium]